MTLVYLMRHGETAWNAARRLQGQADIPLSKVGQAQVQAQRSVALPASAIAVSSDLQRTVETAALMGFPAAAQDPALREIGLGEWEGRHVDDITDNDHAAYLDWRYGRYTPPGGEPWPDFCDRVVQALRYHAARAKAQKSDLIVFCHGGVIRAVLDQLVHLPLEQLDPIRPAGICLIRLTAKATLLSYNLTGS